LSSRAFGFPRPRFCLVCPIPVTTDNEVEKLALYVGDKKQVEFEDVAAICSRNKTARPSR